MKEKENLEYSFKLKVQWKKGDRFQQEEKNKTKADRKCQMRKLITEENFEK